MRYADDFVVLCRDVETAERARDTVEASLADLGDDGRPPRAWLVHVPLDRIRGVLAERDAGSRRRRVVGCPPDPQV